MQIFEINKKNADVLVFFGITIISKGKSIKKKNSRERSDNFLLIMAMPKQTCPYKEITFASGRAKGWLF